MKLLYPSFSGPADELLTGAVLTVLNGLTLNGTANLTTALVSPSSYTGINFLNRAQTLGGTGEIIFNTTAGEIIGGWCVRPTGSGVLNIGPGITIKTGNAPGMVGHSTRPLIIQETISAETAGKEIHLEGSSITNEGSIAIKAGGLASVEGPFTQSVSGSLAVELSGTLATEFGKLTSSSALTLDGTPDVSVTGGFTPTSRNEFEIMTFDSVSGDFSTKNGLDQGGLTLDLSYGASNLRLVAP
ncbi:MAG: hypothetical protein P8L44_21345 [Opitutales bacterium]|nr:hypothetical protein [Opitutales bacterium]